MLTLAPLESARFGFRTLRGTIEGDLDCAALAQELADGQADLAIVRLPAKRSYQIHGLHRFGLYPIHADTLVYYHCNLDTHEPHPLRNPQLQIVEANRGDAEGISTLIRSSFDDYTNHYHANPLLSEASILAGYEEWALGHLAGENQIAWVTKVDGRIAGLACSAFDEAHGICDGVLHGVHPDFGQIGIYTDLIRHTQRYFKARGFQTLRISTQVSNLPVQRVWVREGFYFAKVFDTYHINSMLHADPELARLAGSPHQAT
ncbi:MAG TPA: GNAT family N-acetyltransferase [Rhodanobacter sp.]